MVRRLTLPMVLLAVVTLFGCGGESRERSASTPPTQEIPTSQVQQAPRAKGSGRITGFVFEDRNRNGTFDEGEPRLSQQTVLLTSPDRTETIQSVTTGADGTFGFEQLGASDYRISLEIPAGFERTNDHSFVFTLAADATRDVRFGVARTPGAR